MLCFGQNGGSRRAIPIPKIGYNKTSGKKWPSSALLYNCRFYYQKEAQKYPVFCSGHVGGSRIAIPIPKTGYNNRWCTIMSQ